MVKATVNSYRLRIFKDQEEIASLKTVAIPIPKENSIFIIDETNYTIEKVTTHLVSDTNKYPYMEYIIKVKEIVTRKCLRSLCPNGENKCCLECTDKVTCDKLGKCSWDDDNLDLKNCSKE